LSAAKADKLNDHSTIAAEVPRDVGDDSRRRQLIDVTIDSLAELGFVGTTLAQIAGRAGVSPGLVAHYFGDKDGLLEAAFRTLARRVSDRVRARLRVTQTPRGRIQAVIDANLAPAEFDQRTGTAWLAFWGQVLQSAGLKRVQSVYQQRTLSNLRGYLKKLLPPEEAASLAAMVAAMIDGVWLRAALSGWREADSESARALLTDFVDGRLSEHGTPAAETVDREPPQPSEAARTPVAGERFATINPATGEVIAHRRVAGVADIEVAVAAARLGQEQWAATTAPERARVLWRAATLLRERNDELADLESRDTGKPIQETGVVDVVSGADCLEYFASLALRVSGEHSDLGPLAFGYTRREPLGVVAGIGAWNYPLQIACWKSAPALAFGNAMIFKPAELTPLTAEKLEEIYLEAGLPSGVFQVLQGFADTGRLLTRHPAIRKVSLTGAVGGKAPLIVFDDARLDNAVAAAMLANFYSSGQVCSNGTRVFVQRGVKAEFLARLVARVRALRIGDPLDPATQVGSLISRQHMEKVLGFVARGRAEGARLLVGGTRVSDGDLANGAFVAPAVFDACRDDMSIVREQIFGPVMSVLEFEHEDAVVARANATDFCLSAGVFTNDLTRAHRVIARLQAGTCWINHYNVTPFERASLEHYTQLKSVYVALGDVDAPY